MDELTMFASLRPDSEVLPADERAALRVSLFGSSADGSGADPALDAPPSIADDPESTLTELEPTRAQSGPRRRSRRVTHGLLAIAVAAAVVTTLVVISRDHTTAPADTPIPTAIANGWVAFAASLPRTVTATSIWFGKAPTLGASPGLTPTQLTRSVPRSHPTPASWCSGGPQGQLEEGYHDAALVVADVAADGELSEDGHGSFGRRGPDPPCGIWSPDGRWVAFGVDPPLIPGSVSGVGLAGTDFELGRRGLGGRHSVRRHPSADRALGDRSRLGTPMPLNSPSPATASWCTR